MQTIVPTLSSNMSSLKKDHGSLDIFLEFLEICFHSVLCFRQVYPVCIFTLKRKYNVPVYISMYPELNEYISEVLKSIKTIIISNQMERISLLIMDSTLKPVEKLTFNKIHINSFKNQSEKLSHVQLIEESFKAFLLKLSILDRISVESSSFKIYIETNESRYLEMCKEPCYEEFPWIVENEISESELHELIPVHTLCTPVLKFEMYIEKK